MSSQPIQTAYSQGKTCFAVALHPDNRVLDVVNKVWVAYNQADEANYAMPYSEIVPGFYVATYPSGFVLDVLPTEISYQQSGIAPNFAVDTVISVGQSQGSNLAAITASVAAAGNLSVSAGTMRQGIVQSGVNTVIQMVTDLNGAINAMYNGRVVIWTTGALAGVAAIITGYVASTHILKFTAVPTAPAPSDEFVVV